ncbi:MAG: exo-alpha-sialidase [Mucilaginibacter sp.]|uniref:sialidase family protein n=1 Tax=Mucilaginibacter sp. TaxID=1882438 RepID=UPI0031B42D09
MLLISADAQDIGRETEILWDSENPVKIADGNYGRVKELTNGTLSAVYSRGGNAYIKFSDNGGNTWHNERLVFEGTTEYSFANTELIELADGALVMGVNRRVKPAFTGKQFTYAIIVKRSTDGGRSWSSPQLIYQAGNTNGTGCWEPAFLQLPGGELQCYFANEKPYPETNEQEISLLRSFDGGKTWTKASETVSFAKKGRDGMPVPVLDARQRMILVAIEENHGGVHVLQPVIIKTPLNDNWKGGFVGDGDPRRIHVIPDMPAEQYAGAPYLVLSASGMPLISYQDRKGRTAKKELLKVRTLNSELLASGNESTPLPTDVQNSTQWNALTVLRNGTLLAITSTTAHKGGLYLIKGRILKK